MDDEEFVDWYGRWSPLAVPDVTRLLADFEAPWWIVGGYAIEQFTGTQRSHNDIDVAIFRADASRLLRILAADYHAWANSSGTLTPMVDGCVDLPPNAGQIWIRRDARSPWEIDFVVCDERAGDWVWRHDPTVTMSLTDMTWIDNDGVRFARREIVLAHKAKWRQAKDDADFEASWPVLDRHAKSWLRTTLTTMYPDHPWLSRMP